MKNGMNKAVATFFFIALLSLGMVSCDKFEESPVGSSSGSETVAALLDVQNIDGLGHLEMATLETDYAESSETYAAREGGDSRPPKGKRSELFTQLDLTDDQKAQIAELKGILRDCIKSALEPLREEKRLIIDIARTDRKSILERYQAEEIDRETAKIEIVELNDALREDLEALKPEVDPKEDCLTAFNTGIEELLTAEQLEVWEEIKADREASREERGDKKERKRDHPKRK